MSTAQEINLKMVLAAGKLLDLNTRFVADSKLMLQPYQQRMYEHCMKVMCDGRTVCSRRARKLRKAGWTVFFASTTSTGKKRYLWARVPAAIKIEIRP
jgi:hypothetical protein